MAKVEAGAAAHVEDRPCVTEQLMAPPLVGLDLRPPVDAILPVDGLGDVRAPVHVRVREAHDPIIAPGRTGRGGDYRGVNGIVKAGDSTPPSISKILPVTHDAASDAR